MTVHESIGLLDHNIYCPKCGAQSIDFSSGQLQISPCDHLLFVAHDEGFEYSIDNIDSLYEDNLDNDDELTIDEFTSQLTNDDAIKFSMYQPAPSFIGFYVGFKF